MAAFNRCLILSFAVASMASCATVGASDGAGYAALHPNSSSRSCIFEKDKNFTMEVAAHNLQCSLDKLCRK